MDTLGFYVISALLISTAAAVVFSRRLMHSLIFLFLFIVLVSSMFILLSFPFLGVAELIIYNGGIVVLLTVAASLMPEERLGFDRLKPLAVLPAALLLLMLIIPFGQAVTAPGSLTAQTNLGLYLFSHYSTLLIAAAITLIASLITSIYLIKPEAGR